MTMRWPFRSRTISCPAMTSSSNSNHRRRASEGFTWIICTCTTRAPLTMCSSVTYHLVGMDQLVGTAGRREQLLEAAQKLMVTKGFAATSVDQICAEAVVTKG